MTAGTAELARAEPGPGAAGRLRQGRVALVLAALFIALIAVMVVAAGSTDTVSLSTRNATATGTRALAQILGDHGVSVRQIDRLAAAQIADPADTTVVLVGAGSLSSAQLASLAEYPGDLVLLGAGDAALAALDVPATTAAGTLGGTAPAGCDDPDALAAGRISVGWDGLRVEDDAATACFPTRDGVASMVRTESGGRLVTVLTATDAVTNDLLAEHGNAALGLRITGRHGHVVWYLSDGFETTLLTWSGGGDGAVPPTAVEASPDLMPPGTGTALYALALAVAFLAIWRGRRFGALVKEPLPVVVRASESTRGRARLYRRVRASGRAGSALRAAAALRMGRRIGVPRTASRDALVAGLVRATGRPEREILSLLYGPPPHDDAALLTLIHELDALESEVHRS